MLARADVLLIDKTGTLTLGRPRITEVQSLNGQPERDVLALAAAAERDSEHPLAEAIRLEARQRGVAIAEPDAFEALPGVGVRAHVNGTVLTVGRAETSPSTASIASAVATLEAQGRTLLLV